MKIKIETLGMSQLNLTVNESDTSFTKTRVTQNQTFYMLPYHTNPRDDSSHIPSNKSNDSPSTEWTIPHSLHLTSLSATFKMNIDKFYCVH
jgi:hypothetical protein